MNNTTSLLGSVAGLSSSILAAAGINGAIDMKNMNFSTPLSPPTNLSPMDITPGGLGEHREDSDTAMNTSSGRPSPGTSRQSSIFGNTPSTSTSPPSGAQSASTNTSSIKFPKPASHFSSNVIPPTPPAPTPPNNTSTTSNTNTSPRQSRPQLTSRLSSRSGGKRHASIGSSRELPFPGPPPSVPSSVPSVPASESAASSPSLTQVVNPPGPNESATPGWNARLREMGLHISKIGSPGRITPRTPRSGSVSSGAASPRSPEEHRVASYFSFRRRGSSGNVASPGKARTTAVTPPPPPPPAPALKHHAPEAAKRQHSKPSPISEEAPSPASPAPRHPRANLSLDLSATLSARGSTASLPLIGHTPIQHLVQDDSRPRRASMIAPLASPPHVHTPPIQPPAYEYPFLPHHPPRQPLEIRVEENPPGPNTGDAGSWAISVRLPGFHSDGITVGTRRGRVLMIVADNYNDDDGAGHFERRISFGYDADMANIRAEFNGDMLQVTVPRRWMFGPAMMMPRSTLGAGGSAAQPTVENPRERSREKH